MADETVMYQSLLLLGMFAFGAFALTLNNFNSQAEDTVLQANLSETLADIAAKINDLIEEGNVLRGNPSTSTFNLSVTLNLPNRFGDQIYLINATTQNGIATLSGVKPITEEVVTTYSLGFNSSEILFSGTIYSDAQLPSILYTWNGTHYAIELANL